VIHQRERRLAHANLRHLSIGPVHSNSQRHMRVGLAGLRERDGMAVMVGWGHASVLMLMAVLALAIVAFAMTSTKR
jgi:hypothetical protein